ncbi:MAG: DUF5802 family protein [Halobacteria archaeon]
MFEEFSSAYYLGRMYVEPHDAEGPVMQNDDFEKVRCDIYGGDGDVVMKVDRQHLVVDGDEAVPEGTLGVPRGYLGSLDVRNPPSLKEVFLAKPDHAERILRLTGERGG